MKRTFARKWGSVFSKITLGVFLTLLSISLYAQTEITTAKNYLTANAAKQKLSAGDINEMIVSSSYLSPTTGWYHIYFNQTYQSVEVYNGLLNTVLKDGQVAYVTSNFIENIASKAPVPAASLSPVQALQKAALAVNMTASEPSRVQTVSSSNLPNGAISKSVLKDGQLSNENIEVKLYWYAYEAVENEKVRPKVALTWNVRFETKDSQNIWNMQVDATTGEILQKVDDVIHCSFGTPNHLTAPHICAADHTSANQEVKVMGMGMLAPNTYNVFDYPLESPNHGARTLVPSPYIKFVPGGTFPVPGITNGWHHDGTTSYDITRGNNVWAKEDVAADNETTIGSSPSSATLEFDFPITPGNAAASQNAAITNLFYWNNLIHDVLWKYGFDEPSGNFQNDNFSRGGTGGDYVLADAQDGAGTNNANFSTPVDGGRGRMQMYLWNLSSPAPDGDFDNGVISHEYGHGWSIRLTGGPGNSSCLNNAEQGGEGWADYNALMLTTNWAGLTPTLASANIPRGIGTYVLGEPTTGPGIRPFPYSYDKSNVNNSVTYAKVGDAANFSLPHGIGSIWATMLWDMTWEIILQDGQIVNDIYNVPANVLNMRGNVAALKLVNEGLRLQPCSPSFVQARDAIFQADQMLFNGRYRCAIGRAFARRGLGLNASTGASSNDRTVIEDFTPFTGPLLNSPLTNTVCNNQAFNYTGTTASMGSFTFAWTRAAVSGISNPAANANVATINETLINTTANPVEVTYVFTISPDECGGTPVPQPVKVVVNPSPIPTVGTYSVCQNGTVPMGEGLVVPDGTALTDLVNGSLTNASPTYNRGTGANPTTYTASGAGSNVYYQAFTFVSPTTGNVTFTTTNVTFVGGDFPNDSYLTLYQTSFNPAAPATNFLRANDDISFPTMLNSQLTHSLVQGNTYVLVVAPWNNGVTGTFSLQASAAGFAGGPGITQWYKDPSGGAPLATGSVFNPVGVMGSGVPNTATPGTTMFYVAYNSLPDCRTPVSFVIKPLPMVSITGASSICQGATTTLSPTTGGTWVSNAPAIASVSNAGLVTGLAPGMATFTFTETATGCSNTTGSVTIKPLPSSAVTASKLDVCPNTEVTLNANCSEVGSTVNWNPGGATVTPNAPDIAYIYKASCTFDGCTGNESSVEVRTHRILVDLKDVGLGAQPKAIIGAIKDNLAPTNAILAAVSPRLWTILATGCSASESAVFKLTGPVSFSSIDNNPPYAIFANVGATYFSIDHPNYGNGGSSFPNGIYNLVVDLRAADGVGGPFPKNRIATGSLLATRSLQFTVATGSPRQGIEDLSLEELNWASIFQNPVNEEIVVRLSGTVGEEVSLGLVNLQGQTVQSRAVKLSSPQQYEVLNVRQQNAGMYILKAIKGDKVKTIKVVKAE